jgi:hypothetical protein
MNETVQAFMVLVGACFVAMSVGGSFVFGVATVCRWMKWTPINMTVNVNNYGGAVGAVRPVSTEQGGE